MAIVISVFVSSLMIMWSIFYLKEYGAALFVILPIFIGLLSTLLYGHKNPIRLRQALVVSLYAVFTLLCLLLFTAMEGLICIIMATPFVVPLTLLGTIIGYSFVKGQSNNQALYFTIAFSTFPAVAILEKGVESPTVKISTSIEIDAPIDSVWKNVVSFPRLEEPDELMFKTGIAYPIEARIEGKGADAVRYCTFNTGSFIEPITEYKPPYSLKFSVKEQPATMNELNLWKVDAPHLNGYFISEKGEFKLSTNAEGKTLLEGSTWYHHQIRPQFYWQLWSDHIVHQIHKRVLNHIKNISEN